MSSASSAVTYTSVYTDSEPGRVFWGADEELSDGGSSRVIVYGYDGHPMMPVGPPSPDYILGPEEPQTPPVPQDEDEHEPMFIQPHDSDYDPEEYEEDETEDDPVGYPMDEGDDDDGNSSGYDADDEDEDEEEEEEHLAPADSVVVIPIDELAFPPKGIEPIIPPPSTDTATIGARISIRPQTSICLPPEAEVERLLAMPALPPSPLTSLSPPSAGERLARCTAPTTLPSPRLPPSLYPPPVDRRDDIIESEQPPHKRLCLSTLGSRIYMLYWRTLRMVGHAYHSRLHGLTAGRLTYGGYNDSPRDVWIVEEDGYAAREAWDHSAEMAGLQETDRVRQSQIVETLRVMRDIRREMGDIQAELLALRGQPRRAG
nr:hypothetical protein [Tanacetum cinerariifolium]